MQLDHIKLEEEDLEADLYEDVESSSPKKGRNCAMIVIISLIGLAAVGLLLGSLAVLIVKRPGVFSASALGQEVEKGYRNVQGDELAACAVHGEATTGFTRNNHCIERQDDRGSHHICIKMVICHISLCSCGTVLAFCFLLPSNRLLNY